MTLRLWGKRGRVSFVQGRSHDGMRLLPCVTFCWFVRRPCGVDGRTKTTEYKAKAIVKRR